MSANRTGSLRLPLVTALLVTLPFTGCELLGGPGEPDCLIGAEGCACTSVGVCEPGLDCLLEVCRNQAGEIGGGAGGTVGAAGGGPTVIVQAFGTVAVGDAREDFGSVSFDVVPDAISFSLIADNHNPAALMIIGRIIGPGGQVLFDFFNPVDRPTKWVHQGVPAGAFFVFPNTPRETLVPGRYQVFLGSGPGGTADITVLQKRQRGVIQSGKLPLVLWFPRNRYLTARTARTDTRFQQAVSSVVQVYGRIGITVDPISYADMPGADAQGYAVIESQIELHEMFQQVNDSDQIALNYFLVEQILLDPGMGGQDILGISGSIPGPPSYPGLRHGGVAVALAFLDDVTTFGGTMAHEAGHFLGLYHLSERTGKAHDPLLDTPECMLSSDSNGDGILDQAECRGKGSTNLMFWTPGKEPKTVLTNDQRFVMLRNPTVR